MRSIDCTFYCDDLNIARKKLFKEALLGAEHGRVLYVLHEELEELPQLSQDFNSASKHYMKMMSFLYVKSLDSLIESISTLPDWQNVPSTIILDNISAYIDKNNIHNACGIVALLLDTIQSCAVLLKTTCKLFISVPKDVVSEDNWNTLEELYYVYISKSE